MENKKSFFGILGKKKNMREILDDLRDESNDDIEEQ